MAFRCMVWFFSSFHRHIFFFLFTSSLGSFVGSFVRAFSTRKRVLRKSTHSKGAHSARKLSRTETERKPYEKKRKNKIIASGTNSLLAAGIWCATNLHATFWHHETNKIYIFPDNAAKNEFARKIFCLLFSHLCRWLIKKCLRTVLVKIDSENKQ